MNVNDRIFLSPRFPLNTKLYNARRTDYSIIIETIPEYLARVLTYDRPIGVDITILAPAGEIMLQDIMSGAEVLTFAKYRFENGVEDSDFTLLTDFNEWIREDPVDFGDHSVLTDSIQFNLTPTVTPIAGELFWDAAYTTLSFQLPDGGTIQINQEPFDYYHNLQGSTIVNGDIVSTCGASGNRTAICLTDASNDMKAIAAFGMVTTSQILNNNVGRVTKSGGKVRQLDTSTFSEGDVLYVDPLNPGKLTNVIPAAPIRAIEVGTVAVSHQINGVIELHIQVIPRLTELADVNGTPLTTTGQIPSWHNDTQVFDFDINMYMQPAHKVGTPTDNTEFEADGTIKFNGLATVYDDLTGDITRTRTVGTRVVLNDVENSVDFSSTATTSDYLFLNYQMSHKWMSGTNINPHIHYEQSNINKPNFLFRYRWQRNGNSKTTAWSNLIANTNVFTYSSGTLNQIIHGGTISAPTGYEISDIIQLRIIRDTNNSTGLFAGADPYTGTVSLTSVDIHYQIDTIGSRTEFVK